MNVANVLGGLIKLALFILVGRWIVQSIASSRWHRLWGPERTFLASFFVGYNFALLAADALDRLPAVGRFFAAAPLESLIGRIDPALPWQSLGGWLLADMIPWVITALALLGLAWLRPRKSLGELSMVILWLAIHFGYSRLLSELALPNRFGTKFPAFYRAVLDRVGPIDLPSPAPILSAGVAFSLLAATALLLHLSGSIRRRARREFPRDTLAPYRMEKGRALGAALGYVVLVMVFAVGLAALVIPSPPDPSAILLWSWLDFSALFVLSTMAVTLLLQRRGGPEYLFQGLALRRSRWQDWLLGLIWSFLLVGILTLAGRFLGWGQTAGAREIFRGELLGYLALFLLDAIAVELAFRGYVLQKLNASFPFAPSVALAALLQLVLLPLPARGIWIGVLGFFVAGLLGGSLFWLSRSLWLPIAFRFGWNVALGPLLGHPVGGLVCSQVLVLRRQEIPAWQGGGAFGPEGGAISLAVLLMALWMVRWHSWDEPLTPG